MRDARRPRPRDGPGPATAALTEFDDDELTRQHSPLMSPLVWDLAHIGQQEDLWLLRGGDAAAPGRAAVPGREALRRLRAPAGRRGSRCRCWRRPRRARSSPTSAAGCFDAPRARRGRHRRAGCSRSSWSSSTSSSTSRRCWPPTSCATACRCSAPGAPLPPGRAGAARRRARAGRDRSCSASTRADEPWSLDNERPAHIVDLPAFRIGRVPVTNAEWRRFVDAGGYDEPRWWSRARLGAPASRPGWSARSSGRPTARGAGSGIVEDIPADEPVQHVCFFEAEAYAAWAGARLPTEQEWEKACVWDPARGPTPALAVGRLGARRRRWPTSAARRCARRRSAPTRPARRPTASSS